jgi:23S rRNA pseudouridine1911/1915/1917 synthase
VPKKELRVTPQSGLGQRLDVFLVDKIKLLTRSQVQRIIEQKGAKVNGIFRKPSYKLKSGEKVEIEFEMNKPEEIEAEEIPLNLIYSDEHLVVIDKASGMVVHPGAGNRKHTLVNALLYHFPELKEIGPKERPGIVHRLDRETSGLMVVARTLNAYSQLQRQFKRREVEKRYLGLVWGRLTNKEGKISFPIGRHIKHGERISVKTRKPREAETRFSVVRVYENFSLLELRPITGRTHQIRVHLAASGHPLAGDNRYGRKKAKTSPPRLFLHASSLSFIHPATEKRVEFFSPLPQDLEDFLNKLKH